MNKELLFQLYAIHSPSGNEKKMRKFLRKQANECGATSVETDAYGNLLIVKGESDTYPCLAAHMDQVQDNHSKDFRVVEIEDDVLGWSPKCHSQQGLGADDKNGIFICLELLRKYDIMKVAFFVGEETGCQGSSKVDLEFFKDCRFIIQPDRKGGHDLITSMAVGDVCSEEFVKSLDYESYGYKIDSGTITDVGELVERGVGISCLNLSCGYYDAHTDHETTVLSELCNCLDFVSHIVETCTAVYPFEYTGYSRYDYDGGYGGYYGGYGRYGGYRALGSSEMPQDDDEYYFDGGYYDNDVSLMEEYLQLQPDLSFDDIKSKYKHDFDAFWYLDFDSCEDALYDIYHSCKEAMENNEEFWSDIADEQETKKAS